MPPKKGKKRKKPAGSQVSTKLSVLYLVISLLAITTAAFLFLRSIVTDPTTSYSVTRPCNAYDQNDELAAWVNVTIRTNASFPQPNVPINVTLRIRGIYVPLGNWTYAILEGATAAFPDKEPSDWNHSVKDVIVLQQSIDEPFGAYSRTRWHGSRIMNYTLGGDWNIILHVNRDTFFIVHNIPPNPTDLPMEIYTIPNAVRIALAESVAEMQREEESKKFNLRITGILATVTGLGFLIEAISKRRKPE